MFLTGSHELCASEYPFHLIRYCSVLARPWRRLSRISSTLYSSSPATMSGGGSGKFGPWTSVSLYGCNCVALKTGCICHCRGRSSLYATSEIFLSIRNSPKCLAHNLKVGCVVLRCVPSNQTCSPSLYGINLCPLVMS